MGRAAPGGFGLAREHALALLERSIAFGHGRLAVIRLTTAVHCGADVPSACWSYCRDAVQSSRDHTLHALFSDALQRAAAVQRAKLCATDSQLAVGTSTDWQA